jgi:replicative DNA helicase
VNDRQPPHSQDAEQAALGAMLLVGNEAIGPVFEVLRGETDFYTTAHRKIYAAIIQLYKKSNPVDITTISAELERTGDLADCGGRAYVAGLASGVATAANAVYYANIIVEKAQLRQAIETATEIVRACYAQEEEPKEILDHAEAEIFRITEHRDRKTARRVSEILPDVMQAISDRHDRGGGLVGASMGFHDLDWKLGGMAPGQLIIIAGRPGMGKSSLILNIAENSAISTGKVSIIYSLEMTDAALTMRVLSGTARLNGKMVEQGKVSDTDWPRLIDAGAHWQSVPVMIDPSEQLRPMDLRAKLRRLAAQVDIGSVYVDYLQLMDADGRHENRNQDVTEISRRLKAIAKEFNVPVIAAAQLSRAVEIRGGTRKPQLSDLRESGAIEQDADVVMFIHRAEYYMNDLEPTDPKRIEAKGKAEIMIAKQRSGPTGSIWLTFNEEQARFETLSPRDESEVRF